MDSFDLAFLTLTGHVEWLDPFDAMFVALKGIQGHGAKEYLWGPQADMMARAIVGAWNKVGKKHTKRITEAFDLSGDISVDMKKLNSALSKSKGVGKEMWLACGKKVRAVLEDTIEQAKKHFTRQREEALKQFTDADWEAYVASANADHIAAYLNAYPERILDPEVRRLAEIAQTSVNRRLIDRAQLSERIMKIHDRGTAYFDNMSDVQVGRTWTHTGLALAVEQRVTEYMVVSELDARTCPVCQRLHGAHFPVTQAMARAEHVLTLQTAEEVTAAEPFPRYQQLDAITPEARRELGLYPPFHGRCRCDIVFLWGEVGAPIEVVSEPKEWEHIPNTQFGSNPGGQFRAPDGKLYYAKFYDNMEQAHSELLSNTLLQEMKLHAPKTQIRKLPWKGKERQALVTEWMDDIKTIKRGFGPDDLAKLSQADLDEITKQYLAAVMTNNWDVVGMEYDNLAYRIVKGKKQWLCVDSGGTFFFRAQGGFKDFNIAAAEFESLLTPGRQAAKVFNPVLQKTIHKSPAKWDKWLNMNLRNIQIDNVMEKMRSVEGVNPDWTLHIGTILKKRRVTVTHKIRAFKKTTQAGKVTAQPTGMLLKDPNHQKRFEELVKEYEGLSKETLRITFRRKCPYIRDVLNEWQGDTRGWNCLGFKYKVELMETKKVSTRFHWNPRGGLTKQEMKDKIFEYSKKVPDEEYIQMRALTQAYFKTAKKKKVKYLRGINNDAGRKYKAAAQALYDDRIAQGLPWEEGVIKIRETSITGWTTNTRTAHESFGGNFYIRREIPVDEVVVASEIWPKGGGFIGEAERLVLGMDEGELLLKDVWWRGRPGRLISVTKFLKWVEEWEYD